MELIYVWIDKYRTFKNTAIQLTDRFLVDFDRKKMNIVITENKKYISIYPGNVKNVNLILGKNSTGKSNLLDLIGQRIDRRNERDIIYPNTNGMNLISMSEERKIIKKSQFFLIYYMGKYNEEDIFCFEGNDIETYVDLVNNKNKVETSYFNEKYWFSLLCKYSNNKFEYIQSVDEENDYGKKLPCQKQLAVTLLKDRFNNQNIGYGYLKPQDENKITIPRRNAKYQPQFLYKKADFLYKQICNKKTSIYSDKEYTISIKYKKIRENEQLISFKSSKIKLSPFEKDVSNILENLCLFVFSFNSFESDTYEFHKSLTTLGEKLKEKISNIKLMSDDFKGVCEYYKKCFICAIEFEINNQNSYSITNELEYYTNSYNLLVDTLCGVERNDSVKFLSGRIEVNLKKDSEIKSILKLIEMTIDTKATSLILESPYPFENFFDYDINYLSDGEEAYLNIMTTIDEQITRLSNEKQSFIILLDEPEIRMHPELMRLFLNSLISYLNSIEEKTFQLIITSHSPFFASDVPKGNIVMLEKNHNKTSVKYPEHKTFYQNIHTLITDSFFLEKTHGEFSTVTVDKIISFLKEGRTSNKNISEIEKHKKIASLIGEPIIRESLLFELNKLYDTDRVESLILQYKNMNSEDREAVNKYIDEIGKLK